MSHAKWLADMFLKAFVPQKAQNVPIDLVMESTSQEQDMRGSLSELLVGRRLEIEDNKQSRSSEEAQNKMPAPD
jgi:hypothetical protein